jgi:hypothetical protein
MKKVPLLGKRLVQQAECTVWVDESPAGQLTLELREPYSDQPQRDRTILLGRRRDGQSLIGWVALTRRNSGLTGHIESVGFVPTDGDVDVRATTSDGVFRFIGGALLDADSTFAWHDESNPLWEPLLDPNTTSGEPLA